MPSSSFHSLKPGTLLSPTAVVLVSCADEQGKPNLITLAWVGTVNTHPPMLSISVRKERYSHGLILDSGEFVVNLVSREMAERVDFCGVKSGRDVDKLAHCGFIPLPADGMTQAPAIAQSPAYLACKVHSSQDLGSHTLIIGQVVGMGVRDDLLDDSGKICFDRADLVAYSHGEYSGLGKPFGFFGYSVARPEVLKRRLKK